MEDVHNCYINFFQNVSVPMCIYSEDFRIIDVNRMALNILDHDTVSLLRDGSIGLQARMEKLNGLFSEYAITSYPIIDGNENRLGYCGILGKVSRLPQEAGSDIRMLQNFNSLFENTYDAILFLREDGGIAYFNSRAEKLFSLNNIELSRKRIWDLIGPDPSEQRDFLAVWNETGIRGNGSIEIEMMRMMENVSFYAEIFMKKNTLNDSDYIIASIRDISENKHSLFELRGIYEKQKAFHKEAVEMMSRAIEMRDPYTTGHQKRVGELGGFIAAMMGMKYDDVLGIMMAGIIHDIGKICIPSEILSKPGKLDRTEMNLIKRHPTDGYNIIKEIDSPWPLNDVVRNHHEHLDGTGYPRGIGDNEIPVEAKIIAVADTVDAIASHRPYRSSLGIDFAVSEILKYRDTHYCPKVVDACIAVLNKKKIY